MISSNGDVPIGMPSGVLRARDLHPTLLSTVLAVSPASGPPQLAEVWPAFQRWMERPLVPGVAATVEFEGILFGGTKGVAGSGTAPAGISSEFFCCLEFIRNVADDRTVLVGLYYPADQDWWDVALVAGWDPGQPFVIEDWCREPGPYGEFVAEVEASSWFQLGLRKRAGAVQVIDSFEFEDMQVEGGRAWPTE